MATDKAVSEPVCFADRRGKSSSRSQIIILLRTHWQKMAEFMVPLQQEAFLYSLMYSQRNVQYSCKITPLNALVNNWAKL